MRRCIQKIIFDRGIRDIKQIDLNSPVFQKLSILEIKDLIEDVWHRDLTPMDKVFEKLIGKSETYDPFGENSNGGWVPAHDLIYSGLKTKKFKAGSSLLAYSAVELWNVVFKRWRGSVVNGMPLAPRMCYGISTSVARTEQQYFLVGNNSIPFRVMTEKGGGTKLTEKKTAMGSIPMSTLTLISSLEVEHHEKEMLLHQKIIRHIRNEI